MQFTVYILHSLSKDKFYIGYTSDLSERVKRHNQKSLGFTGSFNDWELVYVEFFDNKTDAILRERQIKNWKSRVKILELIANSNCD